MTAALEVHGLAKRYRRVAALRGLDFEVPAGSICGFLGPNGAGKTTTMRILMGLAKPSAGGVTVLGESGRPGLATRTRIGYLPQHPSYFPRSTARSVMRFVVRRYLEGPAAELNSRADHTLEVVGLGDRADRKVKALSGGERQRLGIAQAVVGDPDLLILDEPSVGLDPQGRHDVLSLLDDLSQRMTIFYSSHILDDVERIADHVVVLDHGLVVEQGPMESFLSVGSASYRVMLGGEDAASAMSLVQEQDWVTRTNPVGPGAWQVEAADRVAAERQLARLVTAVPGVRLEELRPSRRDLEDVYTELLRAGGQPLGAGEVAAGVEDD